MIEAAGGVVWRISADRQVEVLIVHRRRQRDWSLPKGRLDSGESALACATREVHEETGLVCVARTELPAVRYSDRRGRSRRVRYWSMEVVGGEFQPNREVDLITWVRVTLAGELLTSPREAAVVTTLPPALLSLHPSFRLTTTDVPSLAGAHFIVGGAGGHSVPSGGKRKQAPPGGDACRAER